MPFEKEKFLLPEFDKTPHLPFNPNKHDDDIIAPAQEAEDAMNTVVFVEEKIDGANCGMRLQGSNPIIRNRKHILCKGFVKETPAKKQFASVWNWFYDHKSLFEKLNQLVNAEVSVYGEWMYAKHTIFYDQLPSLFIAYDIYLPEKYSFLDTYATRIYLEKAGFSIPELLHNGRIESYDYLAKLCYGQSAFSSDQKREGVYLKVNAPGGLTVGRRFKMVRPDFKTDPDWNFKPLERNLLKK